MRIVGALGVALAGLSVFVAASASAYEQGDTGSPYGETTAVVVDGEGNMRVPPDYRTSYQVLGTWAVAADDGPGSKMDAFLTALSL